MKFEIIRKPVWSSPRILLYGPPKCGKTTLAASIPNSLMIQVEDGADAHGNDKLPQPEDFDQLLEQVEFCKEVSHHIIVLDSITEAGKLAEQKVLKDGNKESLAKFPFGQGFQQVGDLIVKLTDALDELRAAGKSVVMVGHAASKTVEDPSLPEPYEQWEIDIPKRVLNRIVKWSDALLFCSSQVLLNRKEDSHRPRPVGGDMQIHCNAKPSYRAGNRYGFPDSIDFTWAAIASQIKQHKARILEEK